MFRSIVQRHAQLQSRYLNSRLMQVYLDHPFQILATGTTLGGMISLSVGVCNNDNDLRLMEKTFMGAGCGWFVSALPVLVPIVPFACGLAAAGAAAGGVAYGAGKTCRFVRTSRSRIH